MPAGKNQRWGIIALIISVIAITSWVFTRPTEQALEQPAGTTAERVDEVVPEPELDSPEPDVKGEVDEAGGGRDAYWVKNGQQGKNQPERQSNVSESSNSGYADWEIEEVARDALDSAMDGDIDDAIAVSDLIRQCRSGFDNEQRVQNQLNVMAKRVHQGKSIPSSFHIGSGEKIQFTTIAEYEIFMWTRFSQCDATRGMFDQQLRERLVQLAGNGSVSARYMYAMWLPEKSNLNQHQMTDWLIYQNLALEFTWQNINAGEPLGLLAYGQSLETVHPPYFTTRNRNYGQAFILAAEKCGLENSSVAKKVDSIAKMWSQRQMSQYLNSIELLSDEIIATFCEPGLNR